MAISFIQRFVEDAVNIGLHGAGNFTKGTFRRGHKAAGWKGRGKDIANSWDVKNGFAKGAWDDMAAHYERSWVGTSKKPASFMHKAAFVANTPFHAAHMVMGAGSDLAKGVVGTAATGLGTVAGAAGIATLGAGKLALKGGWKLTKAVGPGIAKGTLKGTAALGYVTARDTGTIAAAGAKFLWNTRKDPLVGTALVAGAIGVGATVGDREFNERTYYGTPDGGKYGTQKGFGYMNPEISGGAWQLNKTGPSSPQIAELQKRMNEQGGYEGIHTTKGPMGDESGATGDLVFALNQLRQGGLF